MSYIFQTDWNFCSIWLKSIPNLLFPQGRVISSITRPSVDTTGGTTLDQAFEHNDELEQTQVCKLFTRSHIFITNNSYFT
jgi:hypothetical protein